MTLYIKVQASKTKTMVQRTPVFDYIITGVIEDTGGSWLEVGGLIFKWLK